MSFIWIILWCFTYFSVEIQAKCQNLKVFDSTREITDGVKCREVEILFDCAAGPYIPHDLADGPPVENPGNFVINPLLEISLMEDKFLYQVTRLKMSWDGPTNETGRRDLKGFSLDMFNVYEAYPRKCHIFDLHGNKFNENTNLRFEFEKILTLPKSAALAVQLLSIPTPNVTESENFQCCDNIVWIPERKNLNDSVEEYPIDWQTAISIRKHKQDRVLEVKFSLPENGSRANFNKYRVAVFHTWTDALIDNVDVTADGQGTFAVYNFTKFPWSYASYYVQVTPVDSFSTYLYSCQCYRPDPHELQARHCGNCSSTKTGPFVILGLDMPSQRDNAKPEEILTTTDLSATVPGGMSGKVHSGEVTASAVFAPATLVSAMAVNLIINFCIFCF